MAHLDVTNHSFNREQFSIVNNIFQTELTLNYPSFEFRIEELKY